MLPGSNEASNDVTIPYKMRVEPPKVSLLLAPSIGRTLTSSLLRNVDGRARDEAMNNTIV